MTKKRRERPIPDIRKETRIPDIEAAVRGLRSLGATAEVTRRNADGRATGWHWDWGDVAPPAGLTWEECQRIGREAATIPNGGKTVEKGGAG